MIVYVILLIYNVLYNNTFLQMSLIKRFTGYSNTPALWKSNSIQELNQFNIPLNKNDEPKPSFTNVHLRLGKLVEQFVFLQLEAQQSIQMIAKNLQIIQDKITIGELDCVFKYLQDYIHLEIVYKFYLYDDEFSENELDNWIGPNRKDSLRFKLDKLKNKQLPLLDHATTKEILNDLSLCHQDISSKVLFKAQLFIPKNCAGMAFEKINNECVIGYYMGMAEFKKRTNCEFYMPNKLDWLIIPHEGVEWLTHIDFMPCLELEISQSRSPLCWVKTPDNQLEKIFIVYWR